MKISLIASVLAVAAVSAFALTGCAGDDESNAGSPAMEEGELRADAVKVLAKDRAYPGDLVFADGKLYWSEARFVGSGDAELDQQFAYWTGAMFSFNVSRSRDPKQIRELGGTLRKAHVDGDGVFLTTPGGVSYTKISALESDASTSVYSDFEHFDMNEEEEVITSAVDDDRVYVLRTRGELASVKKDGSGYKLHLTGHDYPGSLQVRSGVAFWTSNSDDPNMNSLWRAKLSGTAQPQEIAKVRDITGLAFDGDVLFYGQTAGFSDPASGALMKVTATGTPEVAAPGFEYISHIAFDGDKVLLTGKRGNQEGLFTIPKSELGAQGNPKKLYTLKRASDILTTPEALFITSTGLDGNDRYDGKVIRIDRSAL